MSYMHLHRSASMSLRTTICHPICMVRGAHQEVPPKRPCTTPVLICPYTHMPILGPRPSAPRMHPQEYTAPRIHLEDEDDARLIRSATPVRRGRAFARRGERHRRRNRDCEGYSVAVPPEMSVPPQILPEPLLLVSDTDSEDNAEEKSFKGNGQENLAQEKLVVEKDQEDLDQEKFVGQEQKSTGEKGELFTEEKRKEKREEIKAEKPVTDGSPPKGDAPYKSDLD